MPKCPAKTGASSFCHMTAENLAILPEGWSLLHLGRLMKFRNEFDTDKTAYGRGLRLANVLEVITNTHLSAKMISGRVVTSPAETNRDLVQRGDVLFNRGTAPDHVSAEAIRLAVLTRMPWIRRKQAQFANQERQPPHRHIFGKRNSFSADRYGSKFIAGTRRSMGSPGWAMTRSG